MRTLLRRVALWVLGLSADQLDSLRQTPTKITGATIATGSISAEKLTAPVGRLADRSVASGQIAVNAVGLEHLTDEVKSRLLPHPVPNSELKRILEPTVQPLGSGRLAPRPPVAPDLAARDGNGGA